MWFAEPVNFKYGLMCPIRSYAVRTMRLNMRPHMRNRIQIFMRNATANEYTAAQIVFYYPSRRYNKNGTADITTMTLVRLTLPIQKIFFFNFFIDFIK